MTGIRAFLVLTRRELVRFVRQPSRVVAAVGTPAVVWLFFGLGFGSSVVTQSSEPYGAFLLPGMATLAVLFSSVFAAISLIEDRNQGFLQSVLVSPVPRWVIIASKVAGGTLLSVVQACALLVPAPLLGIPLNATGIAAALAALTAIAVGINGLALAAAWVIDSVQGFHGLMNLVLMPLWLLSGALFPSSGASPGLRWIMYADPLYWPTAAVRRALSDVAPPEPLAGGTIWALTLLAAAAGIAFACATVGRGRAARPA